MFSLVTLNVLHFVYTSAIRDKISMKIFASSHVKIRDITFQAFWAHILQIFFILRRRDEIMVVMPS